MTNYIENIYASTKNLNKNLKELSLSYAQKHWMQKNKNNPRILKNQFAPSSRKFEIIIEPRTQGQEAWDPCQQDGRRLVHLALPKSLLRRDNWILGAWCSWREGGKARGVPNCYRQVRERSSFRVQGQRTWHPFLTRALLYRRPTFSRACFDVELVRERERERNFRFSKSFETVWLVSDGFPKRSWSRSFVLSYPVRGGKLETRDTSRYKRRELDFIVSDPDSKTILGF